MGANDATERALGYLGLAARAGRAIVGVPLICAALKSGAAGKTPLVVLEASDSAENSHTRVKNRTAYYGVPAYRLSCDTARLALAVGKRGAAVAAVGVTEPHLAEAITACLSER